MENSLETG